MAFDLRSLPDERGRARIFLVQLPVRPKKSSLTAVDVPTTLAWIDGVGLDLAKSALGMLEGVQNADAFLAQDSNVRLDEETGIRIALICLALSTSRSSDKLTAVAKKIMTIDSGDTQYWFSKLKAGSSLPKEKMEKIRRLLFDMLEVDIDD